MDAVLLFNVRNQKIERMDNFYVVAKSKNYLKAKFDFKTEDWDGTSKTAIFNFKNDSKRMILDENNMCDVPWEFTAEAGTYTVGVFGGELITVDEATVIVHKSSYKDATETSEPTPNEYEQIIALMEETKKIAQSVRDDADNGVFDGEQGKKGETGATGKSAYQTAVDNGFEGTEAEWLDSLKGANGEDLSEEYILAIKKLESDVADLQYIAIEITSFVNDVKTAEIGSVVNDVTLTWALNKTASMLSIDDLEQALESESLSLSGLGLTADKTWNIKATDERGAVATKTTKLSFLNGAYYGVASEPAEYNSEFILGLAEKVLTGTKARTINVNAGEGEYIFYCIPTRLGACGFNVGGFDGGFELVATFDFTNALGYTESYAVYRSDQANLGDTTVKIS